MKDFLEFMNLLNEYSSLILMFATIVYVIFTYKLTKETTKLIHTLDLESRVWISLKVRQKTDG